MSWDITRRFNEATLTLAHYRWTILAAMDDKGGVSLVLWGGVSFYFING